MTTPGALVSAEHLAGTQALVRQQVNAVAAAWRTLEVGALQASFGARVAPVLIAAISTGQAQVAAWATPYVATALAAADAPPTDPPPPTVVPAAFAGVTAAGLPLSALVDLLLVGVLSDIGAGSSVTDALASGLGRALLYTATEITDAGRTATQAQMVVDRRVAGYERLVRLPACDRCIVLAGRLYRYSTGFARHPNCDCQMVPVTREQYRTTNLDNHPRALFDAMSPQEQDARFGAGNAAAIRAGADLAQVVNARQGAMLVAGRWTTRSGTTSRGLAGQRMGQLAKIDGGRFRRTQLARPTAGQLITDYAGRPRAELVAALRRFGYVR